MYTTKVWHILDEQFCFNYIKAFNNLFDYLYLKYLFFIVLGNFMRTPSVRI